jgi:glycosyltransferase involved in cell wall biosynthesis
MRVAMIITRGDEYGGSQLHVGYLSKHLISYGISTTVITGSTGNFTSYLSKEGIPFIQVAKLVRSISIVRDVLSIKRLTKILNQGQFDLVTGHGSKAGFIGAIASKLSKTPFIFTAHSWPFLQTTSSWSRNLYIPLCKLICAFSTRVICVSEHTKQVAIDNRLGAQSLFPIVPNGIPDIRHRERTASRSFDVTMVARFAAPKNHVLLLEAISLLEGVTLALIGDGPNRGIIERIISERGLEDRVTLFGELEDVSDVLLDSSILILTSYSEGLPLAILEGMCAGLPIIATDIGGIPELVKHNKNGFLVNNNANQLACYIKKMLDSPTLRKEMGAHGRELYQSNYTVEIMTRKTNEIYQSVVV